MMLCKVSMILAYFASVYIMASLIYVVVTRYYGYAPFAKALEKYPELKAIQKTSSNFRSQVFYSGVIIATALLVCVRPFSSCQ